MLKAITKLCLLVSLIIALFGQALASTAVICPMENTSNNMMMHQGMMDHSMPAMQDDCCDEECDCPPSTCHSINTLFTQLAIESVIRELDKIELPQLFVIQQSQKSLYRPPIIS